MTVNDEVITIPAEARLAADRGSLVEAIKITREQTGLGLKEAKAAVEAYSRGVQSQRKANLDSNDIPLKAVTALHQGKLLEAIKHTRNATGLGLKDSRLLVLAYLAANPAIDAKLQAFRAEQRKARLWQVTLVLLIAVVIAGYMLN